MIDELINPKLDWRALLDAHIRSAFKANYTMTKLSRKSLAVRYQETRRLRAIEGRRGPPLAQSRSLAVRRQTPILPTRGDAMTID